MGKHRAVISKKFLDDYNLRGYAQSPCSLKEAMGGTAYNQLIIHDPDAVLRLMVVEIDEAKHERLNQGERTCSPAEERE